MPNHKLISRYLELPAVYFRECLVSIQWSELTRILPLVYPETKGVPLEEMDAVFGDGPKSRSSTCLAYSLNMQVSKIISPSARITIMTLSLDQCATSTHRKPGMYITLRKVGNGSDKYLREVEWRGRQSYMSLLQQQGIMVKLSFLACWSTIAGGRDKRTYFICML